MEIINASSNLYMPLVCSVVDVMFVDIVALLYHGYEVDGMYVVEVLLIHHGTVTGILIGAFMLLSA